MYAAIRHYVAKPGSVGEVIRRVEEGFVPIISRASGFVGYYALDSGNDTLTSISIFDTKSGADESVRLAAGWVKENIASLLPEPPTIIAGNIGTYKTK